MFTVNAKTSFIHITKGDSGSLNVDLKDSDGETYIPQLGDRIIFRVADCKGAVILAKEADIEDEGNLITFLPGDTADLQPRQYHYEIELITEAGDHYTIIEYAIFEIGKEID